jgi:hypothetical protein
MSGGLKMRNLHIYLALTTAAVLCGCQTVTYTTDPNQTVFSREDILDMPSIQFPANYNTDDFKAIKMAVAVGRLEGFAVDQSGKRTDLEVDQNLSARLQGQFASLKRFTVYSVFNRGGVNFFKELGDLGEVEMVEAKSTIKPDYILNLNINITKERNTRIDTVDGLGSKDDKVIVVAECDGNCLDLDSNTVYFSEKSRGRDWYTKKPGYDSREPQKLAAAIDAASKKAIVEMMNKVGNYFPVGGKITDVSPTGKKMSLDKGVNQGVSESQQCVVFIRDDGVDIPLALGEAQSGKDECMLEIYKWNDDDPDAKVLIERYKKSPSSFAQENEIFAVGYGLPPSKKMEY